MFDHDENPFAAEDRLLAQFGFGADQRDADTVEAAWDAADLLDVDEDEDRYLLSGGEDWF